jgi:hypothetical protein
MRAVNASFITFVSLMGCCCCGGNPILPGGNFGDLPPEVKAKPRNEFTGEKFAFIQKNVRDRKTTDVAMQGFPANDGSFRDLPEEGAFLIGLKVGLNDDNSIVNALQPIYLNRNGEKLGPWIGKPHANPITSKAKAGYIVGAIDIRTGLLIDGLSLKFVRLEANRLNVSDNYSGPHIGGQGGGPSTIGGDGVLAVGIFGALNNDRAPCALGLIAVPLR